MYQQNHYQVNYSPMLKTRKSMVRIAFHSIPAENQTVKGMIMAMASNGIYIHCELMFSDGSVGYSNHNCGIVLKSVKDRDYSKDWIFYEVPCNNFQELEMKKLFTDNQHLKYNWTGVFGNMVTGLNFDFTGGQFCSQICFNALVNAKVMQSYEFIPSEVSPSNLQAIIQKLNWKLCQS